MTELDTTTHGGRKACESQKHLSAKQEIEIYSLEYDKTEPDKTAQITSLSPAMSTNKVMGGI